MEAEKPKKKSTYDVEKIVGKITKGGKVYYEVKWEGYPNNQNTFEPLSNLKNVMHMVKDYNNKHGTEEEQPKKGGSKPSTPAKKTPQKNGKSANQNAEPQQLKSPPMIQQSKKIKKPKVQKKTQNKKKQISKAKPQKKLNIKKNSQGQNKKIRSQAKKVEAKKNNQVKINDAKQQEDEKLNNQQKLSSILKNNVKQLTNNKSNQELQIEIKRDTKAGHWDNNDTLRRINKVQSGGGFTLIFEVEWEKRKDGSRPNNSLVTNWEFRKHDPLSLLDYYERRIKLGKKSQK